MTAGDVASTCPGDGVPICRQRSASINSYGGDGRRAGRGAGRLHRQAGRRQTAARASAPASPSSSAAALPAGEVWSDPAAVGKPYGDKVTGLLTFRGNPTRTYYGTGPGAAYQAGRCCGASPSGSLCHPLDGREGHPHLVRHRLDRPAGGLRAGRADLGGVRRLRRGDPLPRRRDRRAHPPRLPDRRHHQGLGHRRPRRLPAALHRLAATTTTTSSRSTGRQARPSCGSCRPTTSRRRCGTTTGTARRPRHRRLPVRGRREQPVPHRQAQPGVRRRRQGHGRTRARVPRPGLGRRSCCNDIGDKRRLDRELGRHLRQHRLLRQLRRPRPGLGHQRPEAGQARRPRRSASGPATTPTPRS